MAILETLLLFPLIVVAFAAIMWVVGVVFDFGDSDGDTYSGF